ncbi:MAG: protein-export chaperone SecB [bacterium]
MDKQLVSNFYFENYTIENISFQYNNNFDNDEVNIEIETEIDFEIDTDINKGKVIIKMLLWDNAKKDNKPFRLEISISGIFSADDEMEEEEFTSMCKYNAVSILFPFLRSAITDVTKIANITPLVIPLINIQQFVEKNLVKKEND